MTDLTIIMCVFGQPKMLAHQLATMRGYRKVVLDNLNVVIVDDCGDPPVEAREIEAFAVGVKSVKLFRVTQQIHWNQCGGRNLAMHHSKGWVVMLDPDMVLDGEIVLRMMLAVEKLQHGQVVKWALKHVNSGRLDMSSPNTWLLHRDDFFAVGGYDEDFAGHKGWSDCCLLNVLRAHYRIIERPDLFAHFHGTDSVPDAMVKSLDRSTKHNRTLRVKKVAQAKACGGWRQWVKKHKGPILRFPWMQLFPTP